MYDERMISSLLDKMEIKGYYREYIINIIKTLSLKIDELLNNMRLESSKLYNAVSHLAYRGKFIRGLYSYLTSRALGVNDNDAYLLATCIELYHLASLIHDDIIDKADYRRGVESVHKKYGTEYAIIAGDALIIYSNYLLSKLGGGVIRILAESGLKLSDGEALELDKKVPKDISEYNKIVYLKTASFFEGIFKSSAYLARREEILEQMSKLGRYIGYSFQYKDDIFDYLGDPKIIGKPKGIDRNKSNLITVLMKQYSYTLEKAVEKANEMISEYVSKAISIIKKLSIDRLYKDLLLEITHSLEVRIA
jgi:geranylgeranyl pyrophosphate synthase